MKITGETARFMILEKMAAGGSGSTAQDLIAKIDSGGRPEYEPVIKGYLAGIDNLIQQAKNRNDTAEVSRLTQIKNNTLASFAGDINRGISLSDLKQNADFALGLESSKNLSGVRKALSSGFTLGLGQEIAGGKEYIQLKQIVQNVGGGFLTHGNPVSGSFTAG